MINIVTPLDAERQLVKRFDKGGEIPSDVMEEYNEFLTMVNSDIPDSDKTFFNSAITKMKSMYPSLGAEKAEEIADSVDAVEQISDTSTYLFDGNWFSQHPEKLLGEIKIDTDRYGKEIRVLKGDISILSNIVASDDFDQFEKSLISSVSVINKTISESVSDPATEKFVEDIIKKSNTEIGKKAVTRKKKKEEATVGNNDFVEPKVRSFIQVAKQLNKSISLEEMRAYFWHKQNIGQPLSAEWAELVKFSEDERTDAEKLKDWVNQGILFYFKGEYLPLPIYVSGDVYEKIGRIVKTSENNGQDADFIISNYGQSVLDNQILVLNEGFKKVYSKRLIITGNEDDNSLVLKPVSRFAKTFMIKETNSMSEFKHNVNKKGEIDFYKPNTSVWGMKSIEELSLTNAFVLWMNKNRSKITFTGNISWIDVLYYYIEGRYKTCGKKCSAAELKFFQASQARIKGNAQSDGDRLFLQFLQEELTPNQKVTVETLWNSSFNNYLAPDFNKIPVAFNITENLGAEIPFEIKWEKREAVAFLFNEGSGCLAYDVGVGKTISAIMTTEQFIVAGYCKRPFIVVPNQTYRQWLSELKNVVPHRKINGLFNLGAEYVDEVSDIDGNIKKLDEGSITVMTYEGFARLGFNEETGRKILNELYDILNQGGEEGLKTKDKSTLYETLEKIIGIGLKGTIIEIESLGLDYVCYDEAHKMKKVFTTVKSRDAEEEGGKRGKSQYSIQSGTPSAIARKGFIISNYILQNNNFRNVILLTATPFTNSPLEVYSMLSLVGYKHIELLGLKNINDFFDNFIDIKTEIVVNHKLKPELKQVIKGFNNLPSLQRIVLRFFNYKDGEDVGVVRPSKIVIPYTKKLVKGEIIELDDSEKVTCNISMSAPQQKYMDDIVAYLEGDISDLGSYYSQGSDFEDEEFEVGEDDIVDSDSVEIDEEVLSEQDKAGVKAMKGMAHARNLALSPYLYKYNRLGTPTYKSYIETSPKLQYVVDCVKSVKEYHESKGEPVSGQVIYMDRGLKYFGLIKDYLVNIVGFKPHEVGEITAKMSVDKKRAIQDSFLGRKFNNKIKDYESISDEARIKVLIGSSSIKEGMNLQKKSTVLYNCFLDWNPTDIVQLQGRIWRQQNEFMYVRIVNPLMIDSIDIFMFQKLEEKTSRINSIWSNDGKSVLKLEEIDTQGIKMALVRNPRVIASFEKDFNVRKLSDKKESIKVVKDRLLSYKQSVQGIDYYTNRIDDVISMYAPDSFLESSNISKINWIIKFFSTDKMKDKEGALMIPSYERGNLYMYSPKELKERYGTDNISTINKPSKPDWVGYVAEYKRLIDKENRDLLQPRGIDPNLIDDFILNQELETKDVQSEIDYINSEEYINQRVEEIVRFREENKFEIKPVSQLVKEFEKQNHLLSLLRPKDPPKKQTEIVDFEKISCELIDENGERKIDPESIDKLTECVENLPQTKDFYLDENKEYTEERKALHRKIIEDFKKNIVCITSDNPIAILTGGSPASGKSTFLRTYAPYLLSKELVHVDADEIRAKLPEYQGWNANSTHSETQDIVKQLLSDKEVGTPCLHDLIYDGTMNSTKSYLPLIGFLKRLGYKVFIVYMDNVPYGVVKQRMLERYKKGDGKGKHRFVPLSVVDDFFSKGKTALNELKSVVDGYMVIDASSKDYDVIEEGGMKLPENREYSKMNGKVTKQPEIDLETQQLIEAIDVLKTLAEFSEGNELDEINEAIETLELLLEF
jgi:predicted ABC-type ATPase